MKYDFIQKNKHSNVILLFGISSLILTFTFQNRQAYKKLENLRLYYLYFKQIFSQYSQI